MNKPKQAWLEIWNERANAESIFAQTGRSSFSLPDFFLSVGDINNALALNKGDSLLDIGGGAGLIAMALSPFVREIELFDFAEEQVALAKSNTMDFNNIIVYQNDILSMEGIKENYFSKILVGSVLQYLSDYNEIKTAFDNIYRHLAPGGRVLFMYTPDIRKKSEHLQSYKKLNWDKERLERTLKVENERFWLDISRLSDIAKEKGFSSFEEANIHQKLQQARNMFDFILIK